MNQYFHGISSIFLTEVNFDNSEGNQPSYFQIDYFFKILWWFHEAHIWVECRRKNKIFFSSAFYLIMCLMKSPKNFEKIAILKMWELIFFWGVKIHFGEKYAWFAIEILIHRSKSCLLYMLWSQIIIKKSSRYNTDYYM